MTHRFRLLVLVALAAIVVVAGVSGCAAPSTPSSNSSSPASGPNPVVTQKDAGTTVLGVPGKPIVVILPANPSTGYTWQASVVPTFAVQVGDPVFASTAASGVVGAGGTQTFTFMVKAAGVGPLTLGYLRPFEKGKPPAQTFTVTVNASY